MYNLVCLVMVQSQHDVNDVNPYDYAADMIIPNTTMKQSTTWNPNRSE